MTLDRALGAEPAGAPGAPRRAGRGRRLGRRSIRRSGASATLDAVKRLLLRESQVQPLLLVFEDLHWIDSETQALLDSLVESLPTARLLLLVNYRPEYQHTLGQQELLHPAPARPAPAGERRGRCSTPCSAPTPALEPLKPLLIERTEGNPLLPGGERPDAGRDGALVGERGAYRLAGPLDAIQVPATVQAVLAARIDRLPPEDKRLLQTAAVIGKDVPFALLQAIAELAGGRRSAARLARLQAAEFLYETQLFPELEYTFKHALTHEVAYGSLLQERRRGLHARIVEAIERSTPTPGRAGRAAGAPRVRGRRLGARR